MWVQNEKIYEVHCVCADCKTKLNSTKQITGKELSDSWTQIVIGSGFAAGNCPNGCRATFSDLNINTDLKVYDVALGIYHDKDLHEELFR